MPASQLGCCILAGRFIIYFASVETEGLLVSGQKLDGVE
jgi:hypothetical protein